MTAVGHLETHGYVTVLRNSAGEQHILLTPDLLVNLAASIMLLADKNPRELGAVSETELCRQVSLRRTQRVGTSAKRKSCSTPPSCASSNTTSASARPSADDTLLIFPSLIKQKRPLQDDLPATDDISYVVRGRVENLYASLVVLLGYTPSFYAHQPMAEPGAVRNGARDRSAASVSSKSAKAKSNWCCITATKCPAKGREQFQELFEQFLYQRDVDVTRFPPVDLQESPPHRTRHRHQARARRQGLCVLRRMRRQNLPPRFRPTADHRHRRVAVAATRRSGGALAQRVRSPIDARQKLSARVGDAALLRQPSARTSPVGRKTGSRLARRGRVRGRESRAGSAG